MSKTAIVILNWNGRKLLERFLPSVLEHSKGCGVYVADNGSTDGSAEFVSTAFPSVKVIAFGRNEGFARGYNLALQQVEADYYVILNSDVEVGKGWMEPVLAMMEKDPSVGACQPKMLSEKKRSEFEYAGAAGGFIDRYGFPFCRGRMFTTLERDRGQHDSDLEVFWASGACLFVRSDAFRAAGGFDEDFFVHMEEIDLCWRIKTAGYRIMYCAASSVYHVGGATLNKASARKTYLNFRNNLCMLYKNVPGYRLASTLAVKLVLDGIASVKFFLEGHWASSLAVFRAHLYFYSGLRRLRKKRKAIQQGGHSVSENCIYNGSIVVDYYLAGRRKFSMLRMDHFSTKTLQRQPVGIEAEAGNASPAYRGDE